MISGGVVCGAERGFAAERGAFGCGAGWSQERERVVGVEVEAPPSLVDAGRRCRCRCRAASHFTLALLLELASTPRKNNITSLQRTVPE